MSGGSVMEPTDRPVGLRRNRDNLPQLRCVETLENGNGGGGSVPRRTASRDSLGKGGDLDTGGSTCQRSHHLSELYGIDQGKRRLGTGMWRVKMDMFLSELH